MRDDELFERAVSWSAATVGEAGMLAARQRFEERTGPIAEDAPDYESRMAHFIEQTMCEPRSGKTLVEAFAEASPSLPAESLRQLAGWLRSHRSLYAFDGFRDDRGHVRDLVGGGVYRFSPQGADEQLSVGDRFDGRLLSLAAGIYLSTGRVYHPRAAHPAMDRLLADPEARELPPGALLDGLMRMRTRLMNFGTIRPEHVYRVDALSDDYFAASWARPDRRQPAPPTE